MDNGKRRKWVQGQTPGLETSTLNGNVAYRRDMLTPGGQNRYMGIFCSGPGCTEERKCRGCNKKTTANLYDVRRGAARKLAYVPDTRAGAHREVYIPAARAIKHLDDYDSAEKAKLYQV